jgi:NADH:ubiquinone oxidoreductase subunit 3 (subunit A)
MGWMVLEPIIAFLLVLAISVLIYFASKRLVPKSEGNTDQSAMYACGEKVVTKRLLVNVSLYRYLIFFVIIDSPALVLAFAALALEMINPFTLLIYLGIILVADFLLLGGV